jgi:hypothetical protein
MVDPASIKLCHMAMLYAKGQSKVVTTKVAKQVTKVVKTSKSMDASQRSGKGATKDKAMARLKATGSQDDAANAFLARWEDSDNE